MQRLKCAKPATWQGEPASVSECFGGQLGNWHTQFVINAQLIGSDCAVFGNIRSRTALDLCRQLLAAGADPKSTLLCYRGDQVALRIRTIGEGAKLAIREDGLRVVPWKAFSQRDVSPPMRQIEKAV
jgi:hypothetical protein